MKHRFLNVLSGAALIVCLLMTGVAYAGQPAKIKTPIAVYGDTYYKSLTGEAAFAKIAGDTLMAAPELATAVTSSAKGAALGVGDVKLLFADGWREFTLKAIGGNAEIWVANDLSYPPGDPRPLHVVTQDQIDYLFNEFDANIYPSNTTYFGFTDDRDGTGGLFASWGYDWYATENPQRVMVLVYNIIDERYYDPDYPFYVAGYFWPTMTEDYADRNIIHIDSGDWENRIGPDVERPYFYEGTFSHEYEHAIHYDHDPDEAAWVDEGMATLAAYLAGYGSVARDFLAYYLIFHRSTLTFWGDRLEDYGASYLFQLYLLENFGGAAFIKGLVDEQENGISGIENQLAYFGYDTSFDVIYRDWSLANYLDDPALEGNSGAPLGYATLDIPSAETWGYSIQWSVKNYYGSDNHGNLPIPRYWGGYKSGTVQWPLGQLPPYAPMYLTYKGFQPEMISTFQADDTSGMPAYSGSNMLWGGQGDLLFNTATLASDVTLGSEATLSFWTWYDIEEFWDFGFIQISTDGGTTWTSLANTNTTNVHDPAADPNVIANLPGLTGSSGSWVNETFDLSAYEGQTVLLRFLYITDWATTGTGFYVDDIEVSDVSGVLFSDDLESGSGSWTLTGWRYTTGLTQNDWELTYIVPVYQKSDFTEYLRQDSSIVFFDDYQWDFTTLDTKNIRSDEVTVIVSNHLPEDKNFNAQYLLLVEKGNAGKKK